MLAFVLMAALNADALMKDVASTTDEAMALRQKRQLTYTKRSTDDETKVWNAVWGPKGLYEQLTSAKGKSVHEEPKRSTDFDTAAVMRTRFHFTMAEPPETDGPECNHRHCYAVAFTPKSARELQPSDLLKDDEAEMIISHLSGVIYVDAEHRYLTRIIGHLAGNRTFKKSWAITIKSITMEYRQGLYQGIPIVTDSDITVEWSTFLGISGTSRRIYEFRDYHFASPAP